MRLDAWGDEYFPDSILLKEECLVKSCYSFYSPTSLPTLISSRLWCLSQSLTPVAMWQVNNDSHAVRAEWGLFHISCEPQWSHPATYTPCFGIVMNFVSVVWSRQHKRRQRRRESCDVYTYQINGRAVCFNNQTECRDTCNCFDVALMVTNNGTFHDYGVS